ncbi:unnamed protein product [Phyllotreta striolata]|uniref:USP domain-containing protein n=1 Tax=Phyllotreta striolata TaxID=444603 RepID=A0A9N9XNQ1_PHYSR|nr:unnamed protein product [Phyllotreta striolata]
MTILDDDVIIPLRNPIAQGKAKYKGNKILASGGGEQHKRKFEEESVPVTPVKRIALNEMLNGYRSDAKNNVDGSQNAPVATLSNMGNTCFLNSVLYTLRFAPTFLHNLHHLIGDLALVSSKLNQNKAKTSSLGRNIGSITSPSSRSTSSKDLLSLGSSNDLIPKSKVQIVTEKLHELFMTMHNLEIKESNEADKPVALLQAIRDANSIFEGNNQQDAHELLVYLLDNIRETCDILTQQVQQNPEILHETETLPTVNSNKVWSVRNSWKKSLKKKDKTKESISEEQVNGAHQSNGEVPLTSPNVSSTKQKLNYNFVTEDFEGITLRRTKCLECECVTERKEPFYDIPVPISPGYDDGHDADDAVNIFRRACVTTEKLCDSNKYLCSNCCRYNEASREVLFEKLPNIMVLQLKRFTSSTSGVQKVNTYLPTPLEHECFCESCCKIEERQLRPHRYALCCVIMHLGGTMASGHYIAYVRASDHLEDYSDCTRDLPKGSLSASSSEKSLNILKYLKPRSLLIESRNGLSSRSVVNGIRMCKSVDCCGVKINKNVENVINSCTRKSTRLSDYPSHDTWLECDDENIKSITSQEFVKILGNNPNSASTPYLLFYAKMSDPLGD